MDVILKLAIELMLVRHVRNAREKRGKLQAFELCGFQKKRLQQAIQRIYFACGGQCLVLCNFLDFPVKQLRQRFVFHVTNVRLLFEGVKGERRKGI